MTYYYSDPEREEDTYSLPDVEVFEVKENELTRDCEDNNRGMCDDTEHYHEAGWYYWYSFPGCMPEGDANGPYKSEEEAIQAMRDEAEG